MPPLGFVLGRHKFSKLNKFSCLSPFVHSVIGDKFEITYMFAIYAHYLLCYTETIPTCLKNPFSLKS